ncbi:hypothetical protein [Halalkalibacter lacteus]|uniref:hypothetical protein n=1 Tax=Halalkalibacter lacteus TaxID=3090663 RepID=UPI002FC80D0F
MDELLIEVTEFLEDNELTELIAATSDDRGVVLFLQESVVPNTSTENLQINRRVVIVISDPTHEEGETF